MSAPAASQPSFNSAPAPKPLIYLAWGTLIYNVAVILWGAVVRIAGAGAGCGSHWPTCNGSVVPLAPSTETLIEYSHRLTSGASGIMAIALVALAFRFMPKRHPLRLGAVLSFVFILLEGVVGGLQVLLDLTADSTDPARGLFQGVHLANTFVLLAALLLTAFWASGFPALRLRGLGPQQKRGLGLLATGLVLLLVVGMSGAVTALGDLLFAPNGNTPLDTVRRDFGPAATLIENLRVVHPLIAVFASGYLAWMAARIATLFPRPRVQLWARLLLGGVGLQLLAGFANVALRAPDAMQLIHLLLACMLWLMSVTLGYFMLTGSSERGAGQGEPAVAPRLDEQPASSAKGLSA